MVSYGGSDRPTIACEDPQFFQVVLVVRDVSIFQQISNEFCDQKKTNKQTNKPKTPRTTVLGFTDMVCDGETLVIGYVFKFS